VEVAEVQWDVLFMIRRLGVLSESFRQPLGNHSGRADVFRLGEESGDDASEPLGVKNTHTQ